MLLLICGWPACGKTYYGNWLASHCGFHHLDLEDADSADPTLLEAWKKLMPQAAPKFVAALRARNPHWVLTWGAPADCLPYLEALRKEGFEEWFFQAGTEQRSRLEWLLRERAIDPDVRASVWDRQANEIHKGARGLRQFFRGRCIESLNSRGERLSCEVLADKMGVPKVTI